MDTYLLPEASRPLLDFITDLSQWYVRRSRDRIKEKNAEALSVLRQVLLEFAKISAPFVPFMAEHAYKKLGGKLESVHLEDWPKVKKFSGGEKKLLADMSTARQIAETALSIRKEIGIRVRQPLNSLQLTAYPVRSSASNGVCSLQPDILKIIADEINVKRIELVEKLPTGAGWALKNKVALDTKITQELREEGAVREIVRAVNALRKEAGLTPNDKIVLCLDPSAKKLFRKFREEIAESTVSRAVIFKKAAAAHSAEIKLDEKTIWIGIKP